MKLEVRLKGVAKQRKARLCYEVFFINESLLKKKTKCGYLRDQPKIKPLL